ncbi:MAG: hypothetical protein AMXMBFR46_21890 [Acidimicrobiia bacterium]
MGGRIIENPILNSPYDEPTRHFRFDDDGITDEVVDGRRRSSHFVPIPPSRKKGGRQAELEFVRHAYFTGGQDPYRSLSKALRADIDEAAWASLYATTSRPFPIPATGRIAVKLINHYGDEVMQVYEVGQS